MANTKKSKMVLNGLVCILVLGLIGVIVYQNNQVRKLSHALNSASESTGKPLPAGDAAIQKGAPRNAVPVAERGGQAGFGNLEYQLEAAEEELALVNEQLADELARKEENSMMMGPMTMLQTPEGRNSLRNALKNGYDQTYGSLFKEFNLSPEKIEQLKELLADQQIARMELTSGLQNETSTEEDRTKLRKQLLDRDAQNDAALAALLGDENYEAYEEYQDRTRERQMIQMFSQNLSFDDTLSGDQKKSLLEALYNQRKNTYSQQGFDEENADPTIPREEGVAKFMEMNVLVYDGYLKGLEEAGLSESQETQLKDFLERQQAMMKKSMEVQERIASGELDPESAKEELESGNIIIMAN